MTPARVGIVLLLGVSVAQGVDAVRRANLAAEPRLSDAFVWLLGVYLAFVGWWTVRIVRRHRIPA
jgi:hypothetical protein